MKMKVFLILIALFAAARVGLAQDEVFYYDLKDQKLYITIQAKIPNPANIRPLTVELYEDGNPNPFQTEDITPTVKNAKNIQLVFDLNAQLNATKKYKVKISSSGILWRELEVGTVLKAAFEARGDLGCRGGIPMVLSGIKADLQAVQKTNGIDKFAVDFWTPILNYLNVANLEQKMDVKTSSGKDPQVLVLESAKLLAPDLRAVATFGTTTICLKPETKPLAGSYNIVVNFDNAPFHLGKPFPGEDLVWSGETAIESSDALPDAPDERILERNLDLGLSFTSAVKKDADTNLKKRQNVGILDIRLAPWLNVIKYKAGDTILKKWTPIYLNANVATGKITDSTLSLNRVIIGTEWEYRFVPSLSLNRPALLATKKQKKCAGIADPDEKQKCEDKIDKSGNFIDYYRLKFGGKHSSDRDFKQKEITGEVKFEPVWAIFNKPRNARWFYEKDAITGNPIVKYETFGWEIIPKVGFEFGKTYSRRNPASAIEATDLVKRLYGGIEMKFDITSHFSLKIENTLYGRYELKSNRLKNYFKGEIYAPLGNPFSRTTNGLFLSFEKGDAPPFSNTVNVVKFGYRILSNGWNGFY